MKNNIHKVFSFLTSSVLHPKSVGLLISRLLDPMWVMAIVTIVGAYRYGLYDERLWRFGWVVMLGIVLPQLLLRIQFSKIHAASGWDIKTLKHRPLVIGVLLMFGILNIFLARIFGNEQLGRLFLFYELWLLGFFLVSLVWKMSGHAGGIALATGLLIQWFGSNWWPILLLVPLMGWARVVTKNHTVGQVVVATLYSWGLLAI